MGLRAGREGAPGSGAGIGGLAAALADRGTLGRSGSSAEPVFPSCRRTYWDVFRAVCREVIHHSYR